MTDKCVNELALRYLCNSLLTRDVISVLSVQMVVKGKWQGKLLLQNIYMYIIVTLEVVYDHVGKCLKLALCYFIQINLILFWLTTIWNFKKKVMWLKPKNKFCKRCEMNDHPTSKRELLNIPTKSTYVRQALCEFLFFNHRSITFYFILTNLNISILCKYI